MIEQFVSIVTALAALVGAVSGVMNTRSITSQGKELRSQSGEILGLRTALRKQSDELQELDHKFDVLTGRVDEQGKIQQSIVTAVAASPRRLVRRASRRDAWPQRASRLRYGSTRRPNPAQPAPLRRLLAVLRPVGRRAGVDKSCRRLSCSGFGGRVHVVSSASRSSRAPACRQGARTRNGRGRCEEPAGIHETGFVTRSAIGAEHVFEKRTMPRRLRAALAPGAGAPAWRGWWFTPPGGVRLPA